MQTTETENDSMFDDGIPNTWSSDSFVQNGRKKQS